jgi:hypothetical protein
VCGITFSFADAARGYSPQNAAAFSSKRVAVRM